jgi:hypothetical protein
MEVPMNARTLCRLGGLSAAAALVVVSACSDSSGPVAGDIPTDAELAEIEVAFGDDADLSMGALFHGGMVNAFQPLAPTFMGPRPGGPHRNPLTCLVIEPLPPEDPDQDGVPTRLTMRFDPDPCVVNIGRTAIEFSGSVSVGDPVPDQAGYDIDEVIDHFRMAHTLPNGRSREMVRHGTRGVRHDTDSDILQAQERILTSHTTPGRAFKEAGAGWQLTYNGDDAIVFQQPLPNGTLGVEGTWVFRKTNHERSFEVTTFAPLAYDASCTDARPLLRFTEGEIHKTLVRDGTPVAVIKVTWTGCGQEPTREVTRISDTT